jgi:hypothetical protein
MKGFVKLFIVLVRTSDKFLNKVSKIYLMFARGIGGFPQQAQMEKL